MKRLFLIWCAIFLTSVPCMAIEAVYLGGQFGEVLLSGNPAANFSNTIGFGVDVGVKTNTILEVIYGFQTSSHSGGAGLAQYTQTISADLHLLRANDFELIGSLGPGLYIFKSGALTETDFGLQFGGWGDVLLEEKVRLGIGFRYHNIFSPQVGGSFWTVMARIGILIGID